MKTLKQAIAEVEKAHFRTIHDTGANANAMTVINCLRAQAGLPSIWITDLPKWDDQVKGYVMPADSKLLENVEKIRVLRPVKSLGANEITYGVSTADSVVVCIGPRQRRLGVIHKTERGGETGFAFYFKGRLTGLFWSSSIETVKKSLAAHADNPRGD